MERENHSNRSKGSNRARYPSDSVGADTKDSLKLAEVIARRIEASVADFGWPIGTVMGSEAELLKRYEVSRAVLREAIRLVEHHGVAKMRRGPNGGLVVTEPDASAATVSIALYLNYANVTVTQLWEARTMLEASTAQLAAERMDDIGIEKLTSALEAERLQLGGNMGSIVGDFHVLVAELSGNPALRLFGDILVRATFDRTNREMFMGSAGRKFDRGSHEAHCGIAEALISGDVERSVRRMQKHLAVIPSFIR